MLLEVKDLVTEFPTRRGVVRAVNDVSLSIDAGQVVAVVGESGSGKSVTSLSIMRLLEEPGHVASGKVLFEGRDLLELNERDMEKVRGDRVSMIFQEPMTSLNPVYRVGDQIVEAIRTHSHMSKKEAWDKAVDMLRIVGIPDPAKRARDYPHQMSGGMRQRVIIAIALCCRPDLLICDEPTTALDVTIQARILDLIRELHEELGGAVVFISHNMGVIASLCDRVLVMYAGRVVERGTVWQLFNETAHPYTKGLLTCVPSLDGERSAPLVPIPGTVGNPRTRPVGCPFAPRCGRAMAVCLRACPPEFDLGAGHGCACWLACDAAKEAHEHGER